MKTYPYHTPDGIIELVKKKEYDLLALALHDMENQFNSMKTYNLKLLAAKQELQDAVKRMEAVSQTELQRVWANGHRTRLAPCIDAVRTRLIQAAKGES